MRPDWTDEAVPLSEELFYPPGESASGFWARAAKAPEYAGMVAEIRSEGERLEREPVPELTEELISLYATTGSRLAYERAYFGRRRRLNAFALLSLLAPGEERIFGRLLETIRVILAEPTWCLPAHANGPDDTRTIDLFSAETGFTLSEIACLLGDRLPAALAEEIDGAVSERLFRSFLAYGPHPWENARHNWSAVCAGSIGAAALLRAKDAGTLNAVLGKARISLACYLDGFGEDGACLEGLGYWNYGFGYFVYYADLLKKRTGEDLFADPKVRRIASFQQAAYLCGDFVVCFSDSPQRIPFRAGLTHYLARLYPELEIPPRGFAAGFADDHCHRWAPVFRDWIWSDPRLDGEEWGASSRYLPDAQWLISRHAPPSGRRFGFAAKGGRNDEPHNHNDIGHFMLVADGTAYAADLGSGEYTAAYFGEGRYAYDCNGSQGHSVPIVGGLGQEAGGDSAAVVLASATGEREDRLKLDLTKAYRTPELRSLVRELAWRKAGLPALTLTDEVSFAGRPAGFAERVVTFVPPVLEEGGIVRLSGGDGLAAIIRYDAVQLAASVERRAYADHFGQNREWYAIDWSVRRPQRNERIQLEFEWEEEEAAK